MAEAVEMWSIRMGVWHFSAFKGNDDAFVLVYG